jgi:hypothetical protein
VKGRGAAPDARGVLTSERFLIAMVYGCNMPKQGNRVFGGFFCSGFAVAAFV